MDPGRSSRPDWHTRRPFVVALAVVVVALPLAKWWLGPALVVGLVAYYLHVTYTPFG